MTTRYETAAPLRYTFGPSCGSYSVNVPEGLRCTPINGEPGKFWVADLGPWVPNGLVRHDATYHGIRLTADQVRERTA